MILQYNTEILKMQRKYTLKLLKYTKNQESGTSFSLNIYEIRKCMK